LRNSALFSLGTGAREVSANSTNHDYWAVEDAKEREKLPLYKTIPAAKPEELTPANGYPKPNFSELASARTVTRRNAYSALDQVNRRTLRSCNRRGFIIRADGSNNLQCNPIVVRAS